MFEITAKVIQCKVCCLFARAPSLDVEARRKTVVRVRYQITVRLSGGKRQAISTVANANCRLIARPAIRHTGIHGRPRSRFCQNALLTINLANIHVVDAIEVSLLLLELKSDSSPSCYF